MVLRPQHIGDLVRLALPSLLTWARDPEIYGVVIDTEAMAETADDARAIAELLFRLDCFSKPTVTLLPRQASALALALGLVGTHQVALPDASAPPLAPQMALPMAPLLRTLARAPTGLALLREGHVLNASDLREAKLVSHLVPTDAREAVLARFADADPIDALLDGWAIEPAPHSSVPSAPLPSAGLPHASAALIDAAAATWRTADLRDVFLDLDRRLGGSGWDLPSREALQSLRGRGS
jgi:enoyl-CoA hydratase/carnithine racemase